MAQVKFDDFVAWEAERLGEVLGAVWDLCKIPQNPLNSHQDI